MAYGYIYKTTNLINGKMYIGQHKYSGEGIDPKYYGNGTTFKKALKKYGKENFKVEILEWCENMDELNEKEKYWIVFYNAKNIGYNLDDGGKGIPGYSHTDEAKQKISKNNARYWKGKSLPEHVLEASQKALKKLREEGKLKGHKPSKEQIDKWLKKMEEYWKTHEHPNKGKHPSEETIKKLIESHLGQIPWNKGENQSEETKKKVSEGLYRYYSQNKSARIGLTHNEKTKKQISKKVTEINTGKKFINNGKINKFVTVEEAEKYFALNENWVYGRLSSEKFLETRKNLNKNYCWITNGTKNKFINPNELEKYLDKGWKRGMIHYE